MDVYRSNQEGVADLCHIEYEPLSNTNVRYGCYCIMDVFLARLSQSTM